jgi:hypothetical protein
LIISLYINKIFLSNEKVGKREIND